MSNQLGQDLTSKKQSRIDNAKFKITGEAPKPVNTNPLSNYTDLYAGIPDTKTTTDYAKYDAEIAALSETAQKSSEQAKSFGKLLSAFQTEDANRRTNERVHDSEIGTLSGWTENTFYKGAANAQELGKKVAQTPDVLFLTNTMKNVPEEHRELFRRAVYEPESITDKEQEVLETTRMTMYTKEQLSNSPSMAAFNHAQNKGDTIASVVDEFRERDKRRAKIEDAFDVEKNIWEGRQNQNQKRFFMADASISYQEAIKDYDQDKPWHEKGNRKVLAKLVGEAARLGVDNPGMMVSELVAELPEAVLASTGAGLAVSAISETARLQNEDIKRMIEDKKLFTDEKFVERDGEILLNTLLTVGADNLLARTTGAKKLSDKVGSKLTGSKNKNTADPQIAADVPKDKSAIDVSKQPFLGKTRKAAKVALSPAVEAGQEAVQTTIEKDAFGQDFNLDEDGEEAFISGTIGLGVGATGAAKEAVSFGSKATASVGEAAAKKANTKIKETAEEKTKRSQRTQEELLQAEATGDYSRLVKKSTSSVGKADKKLDISEVVDTISRQFNEATKTAKKTKAQGDIDEANEKLTQMDELELALLDREEKLSDKFIASSKKDQEKGLSKPSKETAALGLERDNVTEALLRVERGRNQMVRSENALNKVSESVNKLKSSKERDESFEINAAKVFDAVTISPDSIGIEQMKSLIELDKWTPEERELLIKALDSKNAIANLENSKNLTYSAPDSRRVNDEILGAGRKAGKFGKNDRGMRSVNDYRKNIGSALRSGNTALAKRARNQLASFAETHRKKAEAIKVATGAYRRAQEDKSEVTFNAKEKAAINYLDKRHNFYVDERTQGLVNIISNEADQIEMVLSEVDGLMQAKRDVDPISARKAQPTANTSTSTDTNQEEPSNVEPTSTNVESDDDTPPWEFESDTTEPSQASQEQPTATADASPTVTETTPPEATETASNDTVEQPTTEATQPQAQTTPEANTQTVDNSQPQQESETTKPSAPLTTEEVMDLGPALRGAAWGSSSKKGVQNAVVNQARQVADDISSDMLGGMSYEDALEFARKRDSVGAQAFEDAAKQAYPDKFNATPEDTTSTESEQSNTETQPTEKEASTESESEAVTDEEVPTALDDEDSITAEDYVKEAELELNQANAELDEARKNVSPEATRAKALARFGLKGDPELNRTDAINVKSAQRVERTDAINKLAEAKAKVREAKNKLSVASGIVQGDATESMYEDTTFSKFYAPTKRKTLIRSIPNLMEQIKKAPSSILAYTREKIPLNKRQKEAIRDLAEFSDDFRETLNMMIDPETVINDKKFDPKWHPWLALLDEDGNFNDAAAAALSATAYSWLANDANATKFIDKSVIAKRFNVNSKDVGVIDLHNELSRDGMPTDMLYRALGGNVIRSMGIGLNKETGSSAHISRLEAQLGQIVVAAMADKGLVELRTKSISLVLDVANNDIKENIYAQLGFKLKEKPEQFPKNPNQGSKRFYSENEWNRLQAAINNASYSTVIVNHTPSDTLFDTENLNEVTKRIIDKNKDTDYIIEKLFETQDTIREPSLDPIDEVSPELKIGKSHKTAPDATKEAIKGVQQQAIVINQDNDLIMDLLGQMENEGDLSEVDEILGVTDPKKLKNMSKRQRKSTEAKNAALRREYMNYRNFSNKLRNMAYKGKRGLAIPFYLGVSLFTFGRYGYDQSTVNPQTSKVVRGMLKQKAWEKQVSLEDTVSINKFKVAMAQGLNVKVDKKTVEASLSAIEAMMHEDSKFTIAAKAITRLKNGDAGYKDTPEGKRDRRAIVEAVKLGSHGTHSLNTLTNYARYLEAQGPDGNGSFMSDIWIETDGITNGVIIGSIIFGNGSLESLKKDLATGGIFFDENRDYGEFFNQTDDEGNKVNPDFYNRQSADWTVELKPLIKKVRENPNSPESLKFKAALLFFTGLNFNKASDADIERDASKEPLMQNVYGAGKASLSRDLAMGMVDRFDDFFQKIMESNKSDEAKLMDVYNLQRAMEPLITSPKGKTFHLLSLTKGTTIEDLKNQDYNKIGIEILVSNVQKSFAEPMFAAIDKRFEDFKFNRSIYVDNGKNHAEVFKRIYEIKVAQKLEQLINDGVLEEGDLLPESARLEVIEELQNVIPSVANPMNEGGREGDVQAVSNTVEGVKSQSGNLLKSQVRLRNPVSITHTHSNGKQYTNSKQSMSSPLQGKTFSSNVGPGIGVENIHVNDAGVMGRVLGNKDIIGVHDGIISSPFDQEDVGQAANTAFMEGVLNHNPFQHMKDLIDDTSAEIAAMVSRGEISKKEAGELQTKLKSNTTQMFGKNVRDGGSDYKYLTGQAKMTDERLADLRNTVESIQQYYLPGAGIETELGKKNRELRESGKKPQQTKPSKKLAKKKKPSSVQRTSEMEKAGLKEVSVPQIQAKQDPTNVFGSKLTELLDSGMAFKEAFNEAVHTLEDKSRYHVSLVQELFKHLPDDFKLTTISANTSDPELISKFDGLRGGHIAGTGEVFLKDTTFADNAMSPEIIAHELLHVVTANVIDLVQQDKSKASDNAITTVNKLEELLSQLRNQMLNDESTDTEREQLSNIKELVAYGLSDLEFIAKLKKEKVKGFKNKGLMGAFTAFAEALKTVFGKNEKLKNTNALKQLIELSAAAMEENKANTARRSNGVWNINAAKIHKLKAAQVLDGLARTEQSDAAHTSHLKDVQENIINAIDSSGGALIELAEEDLGDSLDQHLVNLIEKQKPFLSTMTKAFNLSRQELYVATQLEAVLESKLMESGFIKDRMLATWQTAKDSLTWKDFLPTADYENNAEAVKEAKAKYDYLFDSSNLTVGTVGFDKFANKVTDNRQSDFLTRFTVAMTTSKEVRDVLESVTSEKEKNTGSILQRSYNALLAILGRVEEILNMRGKLPANVRDAHDLLLKRVAVNNHKNKTTLNMYESKGLLFKDMANKKVKEAVGKVLTSEGVQKSLKSDNRVVRNVAGLSYLVGAFAKDKGDIAVKAVADLTTAIFDTKKESMPGFASDFKVELLGSAHPDMDVLNTEIRKANRDVEQARQLARDITSQVVKDKLGELSEAEAAAVDKGLLRTGTSDLLASGYTIDEISSFFSNSEALKTEIEKLSNQLSDFGNKAAYITQTRALAHYMVTGEAAVTVLHKNANAVARLDDLDMNVSPETAKKVAPIIDKLASLHAIQYSNGDREQAAKILRKNPKGVKFMLEQHEALRKESLDKVFDGEDRQMQKGYVPDTLNNLKTIAWAPKDSDKARDLISRGYEFVGVAGKDVRLDNSSSLGMYVIEDGGRSRMVSGAVSLTAGVARGVDVFDSYEKADMPLGYKAQQKQLGAMRVNAIKHAKASFSEDFDPVKSRELLGNTLIPTFDMEGKIKSFRYEMTESTKKNVLNKHYDPSHSLGVMEGNIVDRNNTKARNRQFIDAMSEQFNSDGNTLSNGYVVVGEDSEDQDLKEYWRMLPHDAKEYARMTFGMSGIPVKRELVRQTFGYRKVKIADMFRTDKESLNRVQRMFHSGLEAIVRNPDTRNKVIKVISKSENLLEELTKLLKDTYIVKNVVTTLGNIASNFLHLLSQDVPLRHAIGNTIKGYREAYRYTRIKGDYRKTELEMRSLSPDSEAYKKKASELGRLQTLMASSPVHELMEAGIFQTIVEDIDNTVSPFSYKTKLQRKFAKYTDSPKMKGITDFGKFMFATQDTNLYRLMNQPIQMSDFAARFALYEHVTKNAVDKMDKESALNMVVDNFVNYDIPTSPYLQWLNDHGIFMFTKYYMRMVKPLATALKNKPVSMLMNLWFVQNSFLESPLESLIDLDIFSKFNNPVFDVTDLFTEPAPMALLGEVL